MCSVIARGKGKRRVRVRLREMAHFQAVLQLQRFKEAPVDAIAQHLRTSVARARQAAGHAA